MTQTNDLEALAVVAMALCENALGGKRCPCKEADKFNCADEYPGQQARAALTALRAQDAVPVTTQPTNDIGALAAKLELIKGPQAWLERWASHVGNCVGGSYCSCGLTMARMEIDTVLTALTALRAQDAAPVAWLYTPTNTDAEAFCQTNRANMDKRIWAETPLFTHPSPNPAPQAVAADGGSRE